MESLVRYSVPTKFDKAPRGTISKVIGDNDTQKFYIQIDDSTEYGNWITIDELLGRAFHDLVQDSDFIDACLNLCQGKEGKARRIIADKILLK